MTDAPAPRPRTGMARLVSLAIIVILIVLLGVTFYRVITPFLMPLFLAGMVAIVCQPLFRYFLTKTKDRTWLAAGLTTGTVIALGLGPVLVGVLMAALQIYSFTQDHFGGGDWEAGIRQLRAELHVDENLERLKPLLPEDFDPEEFRDEMEENARQLMKSLAERTFRVVTSTLGVLGTMISLLITLTMFIIALYYFLADGPGLIAATEDLIPVSAEYQRQLRNDFTKVTRAVVSATFMAAVAQGIATAAAIWVAGFGHFFVFAAASTLVALIPLAGTWLAWGPCAVILAAQGHWVAAIVLALYGLLFVGTLDNVVRTYILHSDAKLHPLLAFVTVLGALQVMGLWGIFIGPIVASVLHALIRLFNRELHALSDERQLRREQTPRAPATTSGDAASTRPPATTPMLPGTKPAANTAETSDE